MYNVKEDKVRQIFQSDGYRFDCGNYMIWAPDGSNLYVLVAPDLSSGFDLLKFTGDGKSFEKVTGFSTITALAGAMGMPPFFSPDGKLWIGPMPEEGEKGQADNGAAKKQQSNEEDMLWTYARVDISTGAISKAPAQAGDRWLSVFCDGKEGYYYALYGNPDRPGNGDDEVASVDVEVGVFDPVEAARSSAMFSAKVAVVRDDPLPRFFVVNPERKTFGAIITKDKLGELHVWDSAGIERTISLEVKDKAGKRRFAESEYGSPAQFDGKLWVPFYGCGGPAAGMADKDYGLAVVDTDARKAEYVSLGTIRDAHYSSNEAIWMSPSVSPDGKTMAVCGEHVPPYGKTALFLFEKGRLMPAKVVPTTHGTADPREAAAGSSGERE